jgi:hypothetical protein
MTAHVASFESVRPRLFGIAYRTLESPADAEDVVQDAWIRWQGTDRDKVRDTAAFLATTTKRLALNVAQSARARREISVDPWHPEPIDVQADPTLGAQRREALAPGEAVSQRTSRLPAARSVRLPLPTDRRRARDQRGKRSPTRHPSPPPPRRRTSQTGQQRRAAATAQRVRRRRTDRRSRNARTAPRRRCRHELPGRHRGIALRRPELRSDRPCGETARLPCRRQSRPAG